MESRQRGNASGLRRPLKRKLIARSSDLRASSWRPRAIYPSQSGSENQVPRAAVDGKVPIRETPAHIAAHPPPLFQDNSGQRVVRRKFHRMQQRFLEPDQLVFSPSQKAKIAIGILEQRIEANRFLDTPRPASAFFPIWTSKIPRKLRIRPFSGCSRSAVVNSTKRVLQPVFFQRRQPSLKMHLPGQSVGIQPTEDNLRTVRPGQRCQAENQIQKIAHLMDLLQILVTSPRRSVCFSSFSCDSRFKAVEMANSCAAFSFSPKA